MKLTGHILPPPLTDPQWPADTPETGDPGADDTGSAAPDSSSRHIDFENEERFHDEWGKVMDPDQVPVVESFEACTAPENRFIMNWLGEVRGLRVLDLGCGCGEAATYFALCGAEVTAVDLSSGMLELTERVAERYGVRVKCVQQNAEQLDLPPYSFDVIYAGNLLHHVNLQRCLNGIVRSLKPDGRFVSWDPLRHNPIINIYRWMARRVRTEDELPLSMNDLEEFKGHFGSVEHRCFWLAGLWIFIRFFLLQRIHPSKERYWKKIIRDADQLERSYGRLAQIDKYLVKMFPALKRMCWNLVVCCQSPILTSGHRSVGDWPRFDVELSHETWHTGHNAAAQPRE